MIYLLILLLSLYIIIDFFIINIIEVYANLKLFLFLLDFGLSYRRNWKFSIFRKFKEGKGILEKYFLEILVFFYVDFFNFRHLYMEFIHLIFIYQHQK
jgi:hypothetical protein